MPKPTDPSKHNYMFSDDMKFLQKVVIFHPDDPQRILILKRAMDSYSRPGDWDFPGGNVLFGETHDTSILREVQEETGLVLADLHPVQVISRFNEQAGTYYLFINYRARAQSDQVTISHEHTEYRWVTFEEFEALKPVDFMHETAQAALSHTI
jgi:8-oxo-dGTP pyrophosphatase MutT (NUDIX family)